MHFSSHYSSLAAWLAMATVPKMSPQKWHRMLSAYSLSAEDIMFNQQVLSSDAIPEPVRTALATLRLHIDVKAVNQAINWLEQSEQHHICLLYTSPSPRDRQKSRMPSSA